MPLDRPRILAKLDELEGYLRELRAIVLAGMADYLQVEKKRACERLRQIAVESAIGISNLFLSDLRLGLPAEENDIFDKLRRAGIISDDLVTVLKRMKGCRNILVHEYARVNDEIIFDAVSAKLGDFDDFRREIVAALARH